MASPWIDQAGGQLAAEGVVQAGLVAADAGIDFIRATFGGLVDEIWIGEERARHGHHVGVTLGKDLLGDLRGIDTVGGNQRDRHRATQLGRDLAESRTRDLGGDGRDPRFVPANPGIDEGRTGPFDSLGQLHHLFPGAAAFHQVEHRQTEDDDEIRPDRLTHPPHDFHRQAHAVLVAAAPAVGTLVGVGHEELVDEVAFRPHDLDAVVLRVLGQGRAGDKIGDLFLDPLLVQRPGLERVDRCLDRTGRHLFRAVGITPGMEDLHADFTARRLYRTGHDTVPVRFLASGQPGGTGVHPAFVVRRNAAGHHQANTAPGTLGEIGRHALETAGLFLQPGMHRAHQGTVAQRREAQVERSQQMRIRDGGHGHSRTGI